MDHLIKCVLQGCVEENAQLFDPNSQFVRFEVDENANFDWSRGYNSNATFGRIVYRTRIPDEETGEERFEPVVLKCTPESENSWCRDILTRAYFNESIFFSKVVPVFNSVREIRDLLPTFYGSLIQLKNDTNDRAVIVLENLQSSGYVPAKVKACELDLAHMKLVMRKLGEFHAYSYHLSSLSSVNFQSLINSAVETNFIVLHQFPGVLSKIVHRGTAHLVTRNPKYTNLVQKLEPILKNADQVFIDVLAGRNVEYASEIPVLCHGDYLVSNVLFKYGGDGNPVDMKIVDMATFKYGSPILDLAQTLYLNIDQKMRDKHWCELIEEYHTGMRGTFPNNPKVPSKYAIQKEFKGRAIIGYLIASYFLPAVIAVSNNLPSQIDIIKEKYNTIQFRDIPEEECVRIVLQVADQMGSEALADVIQDLIDRKFV